MSHPFYKTLTLFSPLITYVMVLHRNTNHIHDFDTIRSDIDRLIEQAQHQLDQTQWELYFFPVAALIDEIILSSPWKQKRQWFRVSLQRRFFQSDTLGQQFFERLTRLDTTDTDSELKLLYIHMLKLGFKGKYYDQEPYIFNKMILPYLDYYDHHLNIEPFSERQFNQAYDSNISSIERDKPIKIKKEFLLLIVLILSIITLFSVLYVKLDSNLHSIQYNSLHTTVLP